ncbi:hypothetical protein AVEN_7391-1 [Araneus ventricosus]|uniref:Uncharacterized protein n=1 Tax=Araneus ventricosus TaxID=182803 RepID=A0A4Y2BSZ2_ARAVE|nr:hypothetical protein AVEN_7391-1 [Araneus ventricosus]
MATNLVVLGTHFPFPALIATATTEALSFYCNSPEYNSLLFSVCVTDQENTYCSATDSETTTFGRFYTGKGCQAMSAFPEFFVRSCSVKYKHHPSILHFPLILMKITPTGACAKAQRVSESVTIQHTTIFSCHQLPVSFFYIEARFPPLVLNGAKSNTKFDELSLQKIEVWRLLSQTKI